MARILYTCSAQRGYIRNRVLVRALRRNHDVRVIASDSERYPVRLASVVPRVLASTGRYDYHFAGFLGQPLTPFMRLRGMRPLVLDAFVSVFDTLSLDRGQHSPGSPVGRVSRWLDTSSMRSADLVLTDTPAAADFMSREFGVPRERFLPVPVGADQSVFQPRPQGGERDSVTVLYVSTYLRLHGVGTVVEAANLLRDSENVRFVFVGKGPEREAVEERARSYGLENVRFVDWVAFEELPDLITDCDIFLGGHFSEGNEKARRVVPGKVFQGLAMARPVILGDCEANRAWFADDETARIVPMADAGALARTIGELSASPETRRRIGEAGRRLFEQRFSEAAIAGLLNERLTTVGREVK